MSKLQALHDKVVETEFLANRELAGWDPRTLPGVQAQKNQAQTELESLRDQYKAELSKRVVKVFVGGDYNHITPILKQITKARGVVVRGDGMYRTIAEEIEKTVDPRARNFTNFQFGRLVSELTEFAQNNGIEELPLPKLDGNLIGTSVFTVEDTLRLVRTAIRNTTEDDLNKIIIERDALNQAADLHLTDDQIPVFIAGLTKEEQTNLDKTLFDGAKSVAVNLATLEQNEKFEELALNKIKDKLKDI